MTPDTLRVRASGKALVQNHEKLDQGTNAFVGRKFEVGKGFAPTNEDEEVPFRPEYVNALVAGDLEPADDETFQFANDERKKHGMDPLEPPKRAKKAADGTPTAGSAGDPKGGK